MVADVYLLRHAQSIGNAAGSYEVPDAGKLSETGRRQAERLVDAVRTLDPDTVACSPFERTRHTILPYLDAEDRIAEVWPELVEGCYQPYESTTAESLRYGPEIDPADLENAHFELVTEEYPARQRPENESYAESVARVRCAHERVFEDRGEYGESLLIVCHGNYLPRLTELLIGAEPVGRFRFDNVGVAKLSRTDDPEIPFRVEYSNRDPFAGDL